MIATFAFIFILLNLGNFTQGLKPFIVGMVIAVVGTCLGTTTGFALNPARDWSPRLAYTILPIPNKGVSDGGMHGFQCVAQLLGAFLLVLYKRH